MSRRRLGVLGALVVLVGVLAWWGSQRPDAGPVSQRVRPEVAELGSKGEQVRRQEGVTEALDTQPELAGVVAALDDHIVVRCPVGEGYDAMGADWYKGHVQDGVYTLVTKRLAGTMEVRLPNTLPFTVSWAAEAPGQIVTCDVETVPVAFLEVVVLLPDGSPTTRGSISSSHVPAKGPLHMDCEKEGDVEGLRTCTVEADTAFPARLTLFDPFVRQVFAVPALPEGSTGRVTVRVDENGAPVVAKPPEEPLDIDDDAGATEQEPEGSDSCEAWLDVREAAEALYTFKKDMRASEGQEHTRILEVLKQHPHPTLTALESALRRQAAAREEKLDGEIRGTEANLEDVEEKVARFCD